MAKEINAAFAKSLDLAMDRLRLSDQALSRTLGLGESSAYKFRKGISYCALGHGLRIIEFIGEHDEAAAAELRRLLDDPQPAFYHFWFEGLNIRRLTVIEAFPVRRQLLSTEASQDHNELYIIPDLLERLAAHGEMMDAAPRKLSSQPDSGAFVDCEEAIWNDDVMFVGGSVSNMHVRTFFNHFPGVRYIIDYDHPDFDKSRILDTMTGEKRLAKRNETWRLLEQDFGILTVMLSPYPSRRQVIGVMGIHGSATSALLRMLMDDHAIEELLALEGFQLPYPETVKGYQLIFECDPATRRVTYVNGTLHRIISS